MSGNRLFLIDSSALVYRSYYAFIRNPLITSRGEHTSVSYGFISSLLRIINDENPTHLLCVFDRKEPSFRVKIYNEYKANRKPMPEDMAEQLPRLYDLLNLMQIEMISQAGYEADDLINVICKQAVKQDWEVVIVTGDKDLFQLVNDKVSVLNLKKASEAGERIDAQAVKKKMGVNPDQIIDLLALAGDSADNIPGVTGVGPKTALKLLEEFGSFAAVFENADKIKAKKLKENIIKDKEQAYLSYKLVTLEDNIIIDCDLDTLQIPKFENPEIQKTFREMEFNSLLPMLGDNIKIVQPREIKQNYQTINTTEQLEKLIGEIKKKKIFAFDTETTGLNPLQCDLVGISICCQDGDAYYLPLAHTEGNNLNMIECHAMLSPIFKNEKIKKIAQNYKYDYHVLRSAGYEINGLSFDTMLASYIINPANRHNLDALAMEHLDYKMQPIKDLIGIGKKQILFSEVPIAKATFYAAEDADITYRLREKLLPLVKKSESEKLYNEIEIPLTSVLAQMEENGVNIDVNFLNSMSSELADELVKITHDIYTLAGNEFNINSPSQLSKILFEDLGLKPLRKTAKKTGYSTDVNVLTELVKVHDLPKKILEFRTLQKLKSTYIDNIPELVHPKTGRVHTSYNQAVATTGRLSSTDPNLQNIPIRTEIGAQIRRAFIPKSDQYTLLAADYSQVELRLLAHFSEDLKLVESFQNSEDIHTRTASEVYGVDLEDVTPEQRRMAKTANFAVIYGVSAFGLAQQSDLSIAESKEFIDIYYARYPGIKIFMDATIEQAKIDKYVTTLWGRRRYLPEINSKNRSLRQFAERTAVNSVIQGTAADMIKIAMINVDKKIRNLKSMMIMQVHDELVFDVYKQELKELTEIVRDSMENCVTLKVPITVDIGIADNWLECK